MNQSEDIKDLAVALAKAQGQIEGAKKDSTNPHFKSKYADLASAWEACRKPLTDNGLSVAQFTEGGPDQVTIVTRLLHASGQWLESSLTLRPTKQDPQGLGSAITYGRRYSLMAMVGIAPEDDDGQAASEPSYGKPVAIDGLTPAALKVQINKILRDKGMNWADASRITQVQGITELEDVNVLANVKSALEAS